MSSLRCLRPLRMRPSAPSLLAAVFAVGLACGVRAEPAGGDPGSQGAATPTGAALAESGAASASALYNLGNRYQRAGDLGRAVLSYRRAELLAPRDPDLAANLGAARAAAGLPAPPVPAHRAIARLLSAATWTWIGACGLWILAASLGLAALRQRWRRFLLPVAACAALCAVPAVAAAALLDSALRQGVVVADKSAALRIAPFDTAAAEASVAQGAEVTLLARHGNFVQVKDGSGHAGWLESKEVEPLVPRPRSP